MEYVRMHGLPRVAGIIDGTLIPIHSPSIQEEAFVDRKGQHSLNVMVVAGPNLNFFYVSANWPGSVHVKVLRCSSLFTKWGLNNWRPFSNAYIIGDSAYGLSSWLLSPIIPNNVMTNDARRFLRKLKATRQVDERSLGLLKEIFPCLNHLRLKTPQNCIKVILACITIYNIRRRFSKEDLQFDDEDENVFDDESLPTESEITRTGAALAQEIINSLE